jgi:hypothetical protein
MTTRRHNDYTAVTRLPPGEIDWTADDSGPATSLARCSNNYVPAAPAARRFEILPPETHGAAPMVQPNAIVEARITGSYQDRARGFVIETSLLAAVVGVLAAVVAVVGFQTPIVSLGVLQWFWTAFALVWAIAYGLHKFMSPDGNAVLHTMGLWGYMQREQRERWAFYNRQLDRGEGDR